MTRSDAPSLEGDKSTFRAMMAMGCDREMAAKGVGWTVPQLKQVLRDDPEFAEVILRAEGQAEFHRMKNLHDATKEEKYWRAATWWLERRTGKRYSTRQARTLTTAEIQEFIAVLVEMVFTDVTREDDIDRLVTSLAALARAWEDDANNAATKSLPVAIRADEPTVESQDEANP